ncbi:probable ubiquitin-like-specific protease 2B isoform X2 [Rhodamnia argentea]|uniref:Probable ubiquitin-like-specific protease 2B isoform X2 n=1 Tax=Rhodamnia argentea TaxID=178133 RepID=A0A8B8P1G3_9MYRT|nr:probable ubiquitin-like-specific protease 2B isoform X2 [Rhodamnia argentea]
MKSSRGLEVFDFKEEDELPERASGKYLGKFKTPRMDDHSILKYKFLECDAPRNKSDSVLCVDVDSLNNDQSGENSNSNNASGTDEEGGATKNSDDGPKSAFRFDSLGHGQHAYFEVEKQESRSLFSVGEMRTSSPGASSPGKSQSYCDVSEAPSNDGSFELNSDAENMDEHASSSFASDCEVDVSLDGHGADYYANHMEVDGANQAVVIRPEYLIYQANYYVGPLLTFSSNSIRIDCSTTCEKEKGLSLVLEVDDLVNISCQWLQKVQIVFVKLRVISKDSFGKAHDSSGIEELKFAVVEPNWSLKQEMIMTSNVKYSAIWDIVIGVDEALGQGDLSGDRHYFPNFDEPFEEFIYPKGEADAVSISKRDVDLLQPETFINDTIIDFYIKYLKNQIQPDEKHRYHFFNSFFFRKLADLDKDPSSASDGRAAFLRVRKWTRKLNLFEKDYIFIPVNFNLHWSLIVVCHPGEVASFREESSRQLPKVPCILHMDSIKGSHTGLKNLVQSYLWEEWKERGNEASEDMSSKFTNLRFVPLELPQQENSFDCGLFLLHYLECFLEEAPRTFNPFKISKFSRFLSTDWFLPVEASLKRTVIQKLIYELLDFRPHNASSANCTEENQSSRILEVGNENKCRDSTEKESPVAACESVTQVDKGIEISLLSDPSMRNSQCLNESGLVLRELFEPGAATVSFLGRCLSFDQPAYYLNGSLSAVEPADAEISNQFAYAPYAPSGESDFGEINRVSHEAAGVASSSEGVRPENLWRTGILAQGEHECHDDSERSMYPLDDSQDIDITESNGYNLAKKDASLSQELKAEDLQSLPMEKLEICADGLASSRDIPENVIADSEDLDTMNDDGNENVALQDNLIMSLHHNSGTANTMLHGESDAELDRYPQDTKVANIMENMIASDDVANTRSRKVEDVDGQRNAKRLRLTPPTEDGELSGDISEDLHL